MDEEVMLGRVKEAVKKAAILKGKGNPTDEDR